MHCIWNLDMANLSQTRGQSLVMLVLLIFSQYFNFCNCDPKALAEDFLINFISRMQNHSEVVFISNTVTADNISNTFDAEQQISHMNQLKLDAAFLGKLRNTASHSAKFVILMSTIQETIDTVEQIGLSPELQTFPIPPWVLALWPEQVLDDQEAMKAVRENLLKPAKNYTIKHELFAAFDVKGNSSGRPAAGVPDQQLPFNRYLVYEMYTINSQFIFRPVQDLGTTIMRCEECPSMPERRFNLHGLQLRLEGVESVEYDDDTFFKEDAAGNLILDDSLAERLVGILQHSLNFTTKILRSYEWGRGFPNGTWTGAVKDVRDGLADIGITSTTMLPARAKQVAFLPPTDESLVAAFFLPPSLNAIRDIFMQPFKPSLWAAVVTTWLALASAMVMFTLVRKKFGAHNYEAKRDANVEEPDFTHDSLIWALATVCQQGWDEHPHALSLRSIFITASFTGVIAYAGYSAAIVSTLSLRIDPIQSPEALVKSNLRIGLRSGFLNDELLQRNSSVNHGDIITQIRGRISQRPNEGLGNVSVGTQLVLTKPYAFISTKEGFYDIVKNMTAEKKYQYDIDTQICAIKELDILQEGFKTGMFTAKLFPFREYFRLVLLFIRERGILWRLRGEFSYKRRCMESTDNSGRALGANDVFTAFMVLSGGFFLSALFLGLEKLIRFNTMIYIR